MADRLRLNDGRPVPDLLTVDGNPKVGKGAAALGYWPAVMHLAPATLAGGPTVCPHATKGCVAGCLNRAGRGGIFKRGETSNRIQDARIRRTLALREDMFSFLTRLSEEIDRHRKRSIDAGLKPCVRLNGTSDLPWESIDPVLFQVFSDVVFWDYTKDPRRVETMLAARRFKADPDRRDDVGSVASALRAFPPNLDLTFSLSEKNREHAARLLGRGARIAVVFHGKPPVGDLFGLGPTVYGLDGNQEPYRIDNVCGEVVDGDSSDLRFLDPGACIVGLKAKGPARKDETGFVVRVD